MDNSLIMKNKQEAALPVFYRQQKTLLQQIGSLYVIVAIYNLSVLKAVTQSIDGKMVIMGGSALWHLFQQLNFYKQQRRCIYWQPLVILFLGLAYMVALKMIDLQLAFLVASAISSIFRCRTVQKVEGIIKKLMPYFLGMLLTFVMGGIYIFYNEKSYLKHLSYFWKGSQIMISLFVATARVILLFEEIPMDGSIGNILKRNQQVFKTEKSRIIRELTQYFLYFLYLFIIISPLLQNQCVILFNLILSALVSAFLQIFAQEITLEFNCPSQPTGRPLIRKHNRQFSKDRITSRNGRYRKQYTQFIQKDHKWEKQLCLLCDKIATVFGQKCGHLTLCIDCHNKMKQKKYSSCLICGQNNVFCVKVKIEQQKIEYLYSKKWKVRKYIRNNYYEYIDRISFI